MTLFLEDFRLNSKTCIKRSPVGWRKSGLLRHVTSYKRFNAYEIFYDRTRKMWPFNTGNCLVEIFFHWFLHNILVYTWYFSSFISVKVLVILSIYNPTLLWSYKLYSSWQVKDSYFSFVYIFIVFYLLVQSNLSYVTYKGTVKYGHIRQMVT